MVRPLGLTAYLALSGASKRSLPAQNAPRPQGQVVMAFDFGGGHRSAFRTIGAQLLYDRGDVTVLVCGEGGDVVPPSENTADIDAFLAHWSPDVVLWADGPLRPALIHAMGEQGIPMTLVNLSKSTVETRPTKWPLGLRKSTMRLFETIMCRDQGARDAVVRLGISASRVSVSGHLSNSPIAAACDATALDLRRSQTVNRPMWLTVDTPLDLAATIEATNRDLSRVNHRLLLLVLPQDTSQADAFTACFADQGWNTLRLSDGHPITAQTQVVIADHPDDLGLLLRLSPVAVIASTFDNSDVQVSPFDAALLGAALIHGPNLGAMRPDFGPILAANATQSLRTIDDLQAAVTALLAADVSAALAHAAWDVSTRGAPVIELVVNALNDQLDALETA